MKKLPIIVITLVSMLLLTGCGQAPQPCDNECLKMKQEHELKLKELEVQKLTEQAKIEAAKPIQVQVAEIQKQQAQQETSLGEAAVVVGVIGAMVAPFLFLME